MIDALIIGGGPAGVSAALYTTRAGMKTTIIYKDNGALEKAEKVDNFYGSAGITGNALVEAGLHQAADIGADIVKGEAIKIIFEISDNKPVFIVETADNAFTTRALLLATGTNRPMPPIPGLADYEGKGVSHCAICDAFFFKGKNVAVLGSGSYALSEAKELLPLVNSLTILTNGNEPEVTFPPEAIIRNEKIREVQGETRLTGVVLDTPPGMPTTDTDESFINLNGLFIAQGTAGATELARKLGALVETNAVIVDKNMQTNIPGLWAAGDCTGGMKQIAKAVYEGAVAGTDMVSYLRG